MTIENFVNELSEHKLIGMNGRDYSKLVTNQYSDSFPYHDQTRNNLKQYLNLMLDRYKTLPKNKRVLLVGIAPGGNGCRLSGIPFTSEDVITKYPFFTENPVFHIRDPKKTEWEKSSETIWKKLTSLNFFR